MDEEASITEPRGVHESLPESSTAQESTTNPPTVQQSSDSTGKPHIPTFQEWLQSQDQSKNQRRTKRSRESLYNPALEQLPDHAFFRLDRDDIDKDAFNICKLLTDTIAKARPQDKQLVSLRKMACDLQVVTAPETLDVAAVGQQGMGKSLTINALLHRPTLSKTSASGGACTASAIRFCPKAGASDFSDMFDAKIRFMSDEELEEIIQEHIDRYVHFHFSDKKDLEDYYEDQRAAKDAEDFFRMVHNAYNDKEAASELKALLNVKELENGGVMKATMAKAHERIEETEANEDRTIIFQNKPIESLMLYVERYMARHPRLPSLWPIVQSVDILLGSRLTKNGVCLRDLPGLNDINQIRTAAANTFRRKAGHEMIFARVDRVTTDDMVHRYIRQSIKAHGAKGTILILTKKDEYLLDDNSVDDEIHTRDVHPFPALRKSMFDNEQAMIALELSDTEDAFTEYDNRATYQRDLRDMAKLAFIELRAKEVAQEMREMFKEIDPHPLSIFSISSAMYTKWMKTNLYERPLMTPEESGIPAVRRFLLQLCADDNLKVYREHVFEKMDELLDKCRRITDVDRNDKAYIILRPVFEYEVKGLKKRMQSIFDNFIENEMLPLFIDEKERQERQQELMNVVQNWHHGARWNTYRSALTRRGIGRSQSAKYKNENNPLGLYNWNNELLSVTKVDTDTWREFMMDTGVVDPLVDELEEAITETCTNIEDSITESSLPPKLRDIAMEEWESCSEQVFEQFNPEDYLLSAVDATHQFATTEEDIRCMHAQLNAEHYKKVYDVSDWSLHENRFAAQKAAMEKTMREKDAEGLTLVDRIECAVMDKARTELTKEFKLFFDETIKAIQVFDDYINDRAPPDYDLTDLDHKLRKNVVKAIPLLERMVADMRAKFERATAEPVVQENADGPPGQPPERQESNSNSSEPATKKIKIDPSD